MTKVQIELPGVKLGLLEAEGVQIRPANSQLAELIVGECRRRQRGLQLESLPEINSIHAVRTMFRAWGMDPSKYRPSSEALLRRVVQGKGLYSISNIVDICNLGSIETGWPYGCYDRAQLQPPISLRHGRPGERYEGIGKQTWHLAGRPVLADGRGPFGSPISDSTRSMITEATGEVLVVIYVPAAAPDAALEEELEKLARRARAFADAETRTSVCSA